MRTSVGHFGFIALSAAFTALSMTSVVGCSSDSDPGPAGPQGAAGASEPGPAGSVGATGALGAPGAPGTPATTPPVATEAPKAVYTLSNDATANEVYVYSRAADGTLTAKEAYATGGRGTSSGLGDQGALVFDPTQHMFFAVNPGDNSISMMSLELDGSLALVSKSSSGGVKPISVTVSGSIVYTVNAGDGAANAANITGFRVAGGGLAKIAGSTQALSTANPVPAQIQFTPDGKALMVTEKGTNMIDTYVVTEGVAAAAKSQPSAGMTPFGFAFSGTNSLIVSEAFGGANAAGATSSYTWDASGTLTVKSASVLSQQSAPCWVAIAGTHAFVTNTKSNTVTSYAVGADGALTLVDTSGIAGMTGATPADVDATDDNAVLYTLNGGDHALSVFAIGADGKLTSKPAFTGLPEFATGLVAR